MAQIFSKTSEYRSNLAFLKLGCFIVKVVFRPVIRSSRLEVFCKKVFLKIWQSSLENICARVSFLIKKRLWYRCFPVNFAKALRTPSYIKHFWWLRLNDPYNYFKRYCLLTLLLFSFFPHFPFNSCFKVKNLCEILKRMFI